MSGKKQISILSCGIFKKEIEMLKKSGDLDIPFTFLNSMLHMTPEKLEKILAGETGKREGDRLILLYGDCQPRMHELNEKKNINRVSGINCCEIILGSVLYKKLRLEGAFFLLPEWTRRWEEVFKKHLGFNKESAFDFMQEMHTKLIYIDTGVGEIPEKTLKDISDFCGLPYEILSVSLDALLSAIKRSI